MLEMLSNIWLMTTGPGKNGARFRPINWSALLLAFAAVVLIIVCELNGGRFYNPYRGWYYLGPAFFLAIAFIGPVLRVAREERDRGVRAVIFWGLLGLLLFIVTFVAAFTAFAPPPTSSEGPPSSYDRLLNILPAVIAVWGAGLGWYTQHQIAMKSHRTTHAFNLIMQTRTNTEYVKNLRTFQLIYPSGAAMTQSDVQYFAADAITRVPGLERQRHDETLTPAERESAKQELLRIEAVISAKYLLNYFEFMARGVNSGDLDEDALYETIGSTVVAIHKRTEKYRSHHKDAQPLAMQFLTPLCDAWDKRKRKEIGNL